MKKLLTIAMAAALTLAAAGQASAAALETSGEFRARYWFLATTTPAGPTNAPWISNRTSSTSACGSTWCGRSPRP